MWHDFERQSDRPVIGRQAGRNGGGRQQLETLALLLHHPLCWSHPQSSSWGPQRGVQVPLLLMQVSLLLLGKYSLSRSRQAATNQSKFAATWGPQRGPSSPLFSASQYWTVRGLLLLENILLAEAGRPLPTSPSLPQPGPSEGSKFPSC